MNAAQLIAAAPWKVWTGPENFAAAREAAYEAGFDFFIKSVKDSYDHKGFCALYGTSGGVLTYSDDDRDFFESESETEIFLWQDGKFRTEPELIPVADAPVFEAPVGPVLQSKREWLQERLVALANEVSRVALLNEDVPGPIARELSDLIFAIRLIPVPKT